jgi:hypothetical protein
MSDGNHIEDYIVRNNRNIDRVCELKLNEERSYNLAPVLGWNTTSGTKISSVPVFLSFMAFSARSAHAPSSCSYIASHFSNLAHFLTDCDYIPARTAS